MEEHLGMLARMRLVDDSLGQAEKGGLLFAVSCPTNHEGIKVMQYPKNGGTCFVCVAKR